MPLFIAAGIAAAGAIGGALISSSATNKAANATEASAATATAEQARQFNISRATQQPWLTTGSSALQKLGALYGLDTYTPQPPGSANGTPGAPGSGAAGSSGETPGVTAAKATALKDGRSLGNLAKTGLMNPAGVGASILGVKDPLSSALGLGNNSALQDIRQALELGRPISDASWAKAGYGPGGADRNGGSALQTPTLAQANPTIAPPGTNAPPTGFTPGASQPGVDPNADFYKSPDYAFRLSEGLKGLEARASTGVFGGLDSGALRKAEIGYAGNQAGGAFNDYANRLAALAGVGQTTATDLAGQGQTYAGQVGANTRWAGDSRASSYVANGATYGNAIGDLGRLGSGLISNTTNNWTNSGGGMYNGSYLAPGNSAAAAAGF